MKKRISIIISSLLLFGCSSTKDVIKQEQNITNEDVFYHALVGNIMEESGQTNNAISHYEKILNKSNNIDVITKLLPLYSEKNDFVGIKELLLKIKEDQIPESFNDYIISYYIINSKEKDAIQYIQNELNHNLLRINLEKNNNFQEFVKIRTDFYKSMTQQINQSFQKNEDNNKNIFYSKLKKSDPKIYNMMQFLNNNEENNNLLKDDLIIKQYTLFSNNLDMNLLKTLIDNKVDFNSLHEYIESIFMSSLKANDYEKINQFINYFYNNNVKNDYLTNYQFNYNFFTFKNKDALVLLQKLKNKIDDNYFNLYSGILNYRLGYHSAAQRYFSNIKDIRLIKQNSILYINLMKDDLSYLKENTSTAEYYTILLNYKIKMNDIKEAIKISNIIKNNNIENDYITLLNFTIKNKLDPKNNLEDLKKLYNTNKKSLFISYLYANFLSDIDINASLKILDEIPENQYNHEIYLLKANLLVKKNMFNKALSIYENKKMLYSDNEEVQYNLYLIYKNIKNNKLARKHLTIFNEIKIDK